MDMLFTRVRTCCRRESDESMGLYRAWASAPIGKIKGGGVPQQTWPQQVPEEVMWRLQNARKPFSSGVTMGIVAAASSDGGPTGGRGPPTVLFHFKSEGRGPDLRK